MQIVFLEMKCQSLFTTCTWKNKKNISMLSAKSFSKVQLIDNYLDYYKKD